jgi:HD-like signal output (HDOD) protein
MLAPAAGASPLTAHSVGLLHDVGRVALAFCHRDAYLELLGPDSTRWLRDPGGLAREHDRFGADHEAVGEAVLERLRLPRVFREAARHHHTPVDANAAAPLVTLTQVACRAARLTGFCVFEDALPQRVDALPDALLECLPPGVPEEVRERLPQVSVTVVKLMEAYELAL